MAKHNKLDLLGVSAFCESLGMMVQAGIPVSEAVGLLRQKDGKHGVLEETVNILEKNIEEGKALSEALRSAEIFPEYAVQMIEAGEATGKIEDVLFRLSEYYREQSTIGERLRAALIYPLAMIVMIIVVLVIMLRMVLPAFSDVYATLTGSLSASSYRYIGYAYMFCRFALIMMIIIVAAGIIGLLMWRGSGRHTVEKIMAKYPTCAAILENLALYRFTSAYEVFLSSGEMQDEALLKGRAMCAYPPVEEKLDKCAKRMAEGVGFAQAANDAELYEPIYARMLIPGERSGNTDAVLRRLSGLLTENTLNNIDRLINTLEPLLSGILMITIGLALLSVMLPLIGIMNSIG